METFSFSTSNIMASSEPQQFLKLEDLHSTSSPSPSPFEDGEQSQAMTQASPPPVIIQSKPAKKRKSWGQTLPEPKTTLPPRKRAKTDDEKEQRRIERIKRNRAAAHNSRERKRQEAEGLAVSLARANAELEAYRRIHGPLPSSVVLPEVTLSTDIADTPEPSLVDTSDSPASPPSPEMTFIKSEPIETTYTLPLPPAFDNLDPKSSYSPLSPLDPTQHSAEMLCSADLPCRSTTVTSSSSTTSTLPNSNWLATLFLLLTTLNFQTCSKTLLVAIWTLMPSRMARVMQASAHRLTSRSRISSTTPLLLRSMALAQHNAATGLSAQRGASLLALQRSSAAGIPRTGVRSVAAGCLPHSCAMQERDSRVEEERGMDDDARDD